MSYSEVRGILLTVFCLWTWCLWVITIQIFWDIFICESSHWKNKYCIFANKLSLCFLKWVINGSIHKKLIQDIPLWAGSNFPRCFCCSSVFCLEWCQAFPLAIPWFSEQSCSVCAPLQPLQPSLDSCSPGRHTHTPTHTQSRLCSLIGSAVASHVTLRKQNAASDLNFCYSKAAEGLSPALFGKVSVSLLSHYSGHWFWRSWWLRGGQIDGSGVWKGESCSISISRTDTSPHICHACAQIEARLDGM